VFRIEPFGDFYKVIHSFTGLPLGNKGAANDGAYPTAGLISFRGGLYGTTSRGGVLGYGTVFKISAAGDEKQLYSFQNLVTDGSQPNAGLVADASGNLYGTTIGTAFKLAQDGRFTLLQRFTAAIGDGLYGSLVFGKDGYLYGTAKASGPRSNGSVFKLPTTGGATVVYDFNGPYGKKPVANLITDPQGNLFGTTSEGGLFANINGGTVFEVTANGSPATLYNFQTTGPNNSGANTADGKYPLGGLVADAAGNLYGTTEKGGKDDCGIVFKLKPWTSYTILYTFTGRNFDGCHPKAGLAIDPLGNLYGTTYDGGGPGGKGVMFKISR